MKKRLLALLLTVAMVASLLVAPAGAASLPFTDVKEGDWFREAVAFVYDEGIMSGMSATEFGPNRNLTRAQAAQLLYNYEGKPEINGDAFDDIEQGQWYYNAVNWAASAGVVSGMGEGIFAPNNDLTREQLVTILMNYAQYKGYDTSASASLADFTDANQVSSWAVNRLQWAVAEKLVNGMGDGTVAPKGTATRAQMAAIMKNFVSRFALPGGHSVTFVTYGGSRVSGQVVANGNAAVEPEAPTREGASFGAWYTDAEYTQIYHFDTPVTEDLTLYARWNYENYSLGDYDFDRNTQTLSVGVMSQTDTVLEVRLLAQDSEELLLQTTVNVAATLAEPEETDGDEDAQWITVDEDNPDEEEILPALSEQVITALCPDAPEYFVLYLTLKDEETGEIYASLKSIHFTEVFEEFEAKTVYDFDEDRVVNFDEATDNNFGVLAEGVEQVESNDAVNTYDAEASDSDGGLFVFVNADADLLDTQPGDVIYWPGEDSNIISVAEVRIDGDTVTLVAEEDAALTEFYDYIKVDMELAPETFEEVELAPYEEEVLVAQDENGDFAEVSDEDADLDLNAELIDLEVKSTLKLSLPIKLEAKNKSESFKGSVSGSVGVEITPKLVIKWDAELFGQDYFELGFSLKTKGKLELKAGFEFSNDTEPDGVSYGQMLSLVKKVPMGALTIPFGVTGLGAKVELSQGFTVKFSGEVNYTVTHTVKNDYKFTSINGAVQSKDTQTEKKLTLTGKLELKWGPELKESVEFLHGVIKLSLIQEGGLKLTVEGQLQMDRLEGARERHECTFCATGELKVYLEVKAELSYNFIDKIVSGKLLEGTLYSVEWHLADCYLSGDVGFGWGECPNKTHRVKLKVINKAGDAYDGGEIVIKDRNDNTVFTGVNGDLAYLPDGRYVARLMEDDQQTVIRHFRMKGKALTVTMERGDNSDSGGGGGSGENPGTDDPGLPEDAVIVAEGTCGENVFWKLTEDGLLVIYGQGEMDDYSADESHGSVSVPDDYVFVPAPWRDYQSSIKNVIVREGVTSVGDGAFHDCNQIITAELAESVTRIGEAAFYFCTRMTTVNIPDGVTEIPERAFDMCRELREITLPNGVTRIGRAAFTWCGIAEIALPDSLREIGASAFYVTSLTGVEIPEGVTRIGDYAFNSCTLLTTVRLPASVTEIGVEAFSHCRDLASIQVAQGNTKYFSQDGVLFQRDGEEMILLAYPIGSNVSHYTAPDGITKIGKNAFESGKNLQAVTLPESLRVIEERAFKYCHNLQTINLPAGLQSIGEQAFFDCQGITELSIPGGVKTIEYGAFDACSGLVSVTISEGVTAMPGSMFSRCSSLVNVSIPNSVTTIGPSVFSYCTSLTEVTIPDSVTSMDGYVFAHCTNLRSVTLSKGLTRIEDGTFYQCESLKDITIPDGVTSIGEDAFENCSSLEAVYLPVGLRDIGEEAFYQCRNLAGLTIPASVVTVGESAFSRCSSLTEVVIPATVTSWGDSVFSGCDGLININIEQGVTQLGAYMFGWCDGLTGVVIPSSVTSIGKGVFENCENLTKVEISEGVVQIGAEAFSECSMLTEIVIPTSVTSVGNSAFEECTSLTSVTLPDNITSIGWGAFWGCTNLSSLTLPDGLTWLDERVFSGCSSLASVTIPNSVFSISKSAFSGCTGLTSVTIPDSVGYIGESVFYYCNSLTDVYYTGSEAEFNAISIEQDNDNLTGATIHYNYTGA